MPDDKTVDIDTSGPGAEIELPEEKKPESEVELSNAENNTESNDSTTESSEQSDVQASEEGTTDQEPEKKVEDEKKKELDDYSEGVKRRIAKLTKKMREAERQKEAALDYAQKMKAEQDSLKSRFSKLDTGYVSEMESRITSSLEAAKSKLKQAREDGSIETEIEAQKEIAKLGYEEARLADMKISQEAEKKKIESNKQQPNIQQERSQTPKPDPRATEWAEQNAWFGKDNAMTYTAFDLHRKLVEEEGYDPQSEDYYGELDRRIKLEFPHKFGNNTEQSTKPTQTVASATRNVKRGTGRKTVRLTSSQVAIAKKLNVPLEEYAKQVNVEE
jgi:hypothetical protein